MVSLISSDRDRYVASVLVSPKDIDAARHLHANVYREKGWAGPIDLTDSGVLNESFDPWHPFAVYFGVKDLKSTTDELVVAGRMLDPGSLGAASLQTAAECDLFSEIRDEVESSPPGTVVEISGLAKAMRANATCDAPPLPGDGRLLPRGRPPALDHGLRRQPGPQALPPLRQQHRHRRSALVPAREHRRSDAHPDPGQLRPAHPPVGGRRPPDLLQAPGVRGVPAGAHASGVPHADRPAAAAARRVPREV